MPGLNTNVAQPSSLRAGRTMEAMLMRGFTTVRDVGGIDRGVADAQVTGVVASPQLVICEDAEPDRRAMQHARPIKRPCPVQH